MRALDPRLSLAISLQSNPGVYAPLLGSGISRKAGIPTGWEIILDLIKKIALAEGKSSECLNDPAQWYRDTYHEEPSYSKLLDAVAKSQIERHGLLRTYFEPSDEERSQGLKLPTKAHFAIADLVVKGFIRVILTTNFDRLMETALEERGIVPTVISNGDAAAGAVPLIHSKCTVIKIHGDYLDTRIKNTPQELSEYDPRIDTILDRVFDEFGLILCGWSADWDIALATAIERCPSRRFTNYWTGLSPLKGQAQRLANLRRAEFIQISGADEFFSVLVEQVVSLEEIRLNNPLSAKVAEATVKRYIVDETARIRLHDIVHEETERAFAAISNISKKPPQPDEADGVSHIVKIRFQKFRNFIEVLKSILIVGAAWGSEEQDDIWLKSLCRIARVPEPNSGLLAIQKLKFYPAMLLVYAMGVAALARQRTKLLCKLLRLTTNSNSVGDEMRISMSALPGEVINFDIAREAFSIQTRTPVSDHIHTYLFPYLSSLIPDETEYEDFFNRFEYLLGLVSFNELKSGRHGRRHLGRFCIRSFHISNPFLQKMETEIISQRTNWPFLEAAHFSDSWKTVLELHNTLADLARQGSNQYF